MEYSIENYCAMIRSVLGVDNGVVVTDETKDIILDFFKADKEEFDRLSTFYPLIAKAFLRYMDNSKCREGCECE